MPMITYQEAIDKIKAAARKKTLKEQKVPLLQAVGRVLTEDLYSPENLPFRDNSAMDGFAIRSAQTREASEASPCLFSVMGYIAAGDEVPLCDERNDGVYGIMTGAIVPGGGFDAVVKVEDVEVFIDAGRSFVKLKAPVAKGNNIRLQASDFHKGARILKRGHRLCHEDIMALAGLGFAEVGVFKRPKVGVISTGKEVVPFTTKNLNPEQVRNSSAPFLHSYFTGAGCEVDVFEQNEDSAEKFSERFRSLIDEDYDLLLTTGGVSMGNWDYVTDAMKELGVRIEFHKVAIRPGKPLLFGVHQKKETAIFGLPGNPVSTAISASFFVSSYLKVLRGEVDLAALQLPAINSTKKPQGLRSFFKACIEKNEGVSSVKILEGQGSYMLHSLLGANCWAVVHEDVAHVQAGDVLEIHPWEGRSL